MKITFSQKELPNAHTLVITVTDSLEFGTNGDKINEQTGGALKKAINSRRFKAKNGELLAVTAPSGISYESVILAGLGTEKKIDDISAQDVGGKVLAALNGIKTKSATILVEDLAYEKEVAANIAFGAVLRSYRFDKYRTTEEKDTKPTLNDLDICVTDKNKTAAIFSKHEQVAKGVALARDVVTEPPNILHPESYADLVKNELTAVGVTVKILNEKQMEKLGMGSLLGVGQGSVRESQVAIMEWDGGTTGEDPIMFVGKGVTFDTGGISIKPSAGMEDMKYDMGGSAVVVGLMRALAGRKAKVNAVGIIGLVENMPGHNAQRPSDVVTSMSGQTIEVLNTDAEGRLVLADILTYAQTEYKPKFIVDLATLTGAIVVALGNEFAGLFSNNDKLSTRLTKASNETNEKLWRFPLTEAYDKTLDSPIADMQNISAGRGAGSITAAQFLQRFIKDKTPWAHLDIAGVTWSKKDLDTSPKGATAFGVKLLNKFVEDNYEE